MLGVYNFKYQVEPFFNQNIFGFVAWIVAKTDESKSKWNYHCQPLRKWVFFYTCATCEPDSEKQILLAGLAWATLKIVIRMNKIMIFFSYLINEKEKMWFRKYIYGSLVFWVASKDYFGKLCRHLYLKSKRNLIILINHCGFQDSSLMKKN